MHGKHSIRFKKCTEETFSIRCQPIVDSVLKRVPVLPHKFKVNERTGLRTDKSKYLQISKYFLISSTASSFTVPTTHVSKKSRSQPHFYLFLSVAYFMIHFNGFFELYCV